MSVIRSARAPAGYLVIAALLLSSAGTAYACETLPDLHIDVTEKFELTAVRSDYTLADIAAFAHQQHRSSDQAPLGFYTTEFGYTIDFTPEDNPICPAHTEVTVTLRLQHRSIEIGKEAATNACMYHVAVQHYRRLAEVDEKTVKRFSARVAMMLAQASPTLKQTHSSYAEDLDVALREKIRAVTNEAIAPLRDARRDAQRAVNNADKRKQLAHPCSI